jgi:O-antigen/teichoic acid export membrane protein
MEKVRESGALLEQPLLGSSSDVPGESGAAQRRPSPLSRLVRGSATYGIGRILQNGIGILLVPVYTRYLTPGDYGIVAVTTAVASAVAVLLGMGLQGAVTRHYYDYRDDAAELRGYMGTVFLFFLAVGLAFIGLMSVIGGPLFGALVGSVPFRPYIELTLWTAFFTASASHLLSVYRAREQPLAYITLTLLQTLFSLGGVIYFVVVLERGALGKVQGGMWGGAVVFAISLLLMKRQASFTFSREKLSRALAFGIPLVPHLVFGWMLGVADRIYLERMTTLQEVGLYSLGYQIGMLVGLIVSAINNAWVPIFYDTAETDPQAPSVISRISTLYAGGVTLSALLLILAAPDLIAVMADESYAGAGRVVPLVALGYVFQGLYFMSVSPLFYMKRTRVLPALTALSAVVNVSANLLLIPRIGMMGAAWATVLSFAVLFLGTNTLAQKTYHIPYEYGKIAAAVALLTAIALASGYINELPWIAATSVRFALAVAFVGALIGCGVFDRQALSSLLRWKRRVRLRA